MLKVNEEEARLLANTEDIRDAANKLYSSNLDIIVSPKTWMLL